DFVSDWPSVKLKASSADYYFESYNHYGVHEDIFKDGVTIPAFQQAILHNGHLFKDKVVLEVCAGLGLCSLFAAKAGARKVIALEVHQELVDIGREVAQKNGFSEVIEFICARPSSLAALPGVEKVDIIVSVFMGFSLLYEARLPELILARDRWLKTDGLMFPDRAKLFVSLFEDADYKSLHFDYFDEVWGFNFSDMKEAAKQEPVVQELDQKALLSSGTCILNLDLCRCTEQDCYDVASKFKLRCRREGSLDGLISWFEIWFSACHKPISFCTGPESLPTCWKQTSFFFQG
ncbi:prmt-1, partial [Symbiodinium microadriaticum]